MRVDLYARSGDVHIAYRTFGDASRDIVLIPGTVSHIRAVEHELGRAFGR